MCKKEQEGQHLCKCDCGGNVFFIGQFDRMWTWCDTCTPVVDVKVTPKPYAVD